MRRKIADSDERGYEFLVEDAERTKYDEGEEDVLVDWIYVDNMHVKDHPCNGKDRKGAFVLNDVLINQMMHNFLVLMTFVQTILNGIQRASRFEFKQSSRCYHQEFSMSIC